MNALLIHHYNRENKGDAAIMDGTVQSLRALEPSVDISALSLYPDYDRDQTDIHIIQGIPEGPDNILQKPIVIAAMVAEIAAVAAARVHGTIRRLVCRLSPRIKAYVEADVVISQSADTFTDAYGPIMLSIAWYQTLMGIMSPAPVILAGHTIGPFKKTFGGLLAAAGTKHVLNAVDIVAVREPNSLAVVKALGVSKPLVAVTADGAFALRPCSKKRVREIVTGEGAPLSRDLNVAVVASSIVYYFGFSQTTNRDEKRQRYRDLMGIVCRYLSEKHDATIYFVSHVLGPQDANDDRLMAKEIYEEFSDKKNAHVLTGDYTPAELRGILAEMDLTITARTHAAIQSLSMEVPVVIIDYIPKGHGILSLFDINRYTWDISKEQSAESLLTLIDDAISSKKDIKKRINVHIENVKKQSERNIVLALECVAKRNKKRP